MVVEADQDHADDAVGFPEELAVVGGKARVPRPWDGPAQDGREPMSDGRAVGSPSREAHQKILSGSLINGELASLLRALSPFRAL